MKKFLKIASVAALAMTAGFASADSMDSLNVGDVNVLGGIGIGAQIGDQLSTGINGGGSTTAISVQDQSAALMLTPSNLNMGSENRGDVNVAGIILIGGQAGREVNTSIGGSGSTTAIQVRDGSVFVSAF